MRELDAAPVTPAATISAHRGARLAAAIILAALLILPIWIVAFPPLLDYPNHLARAFILAHLHDSQFSFQKFFGPIGERIPISGWTPSMAVLARIFPIETAGRVFLSLCVLALAGGHVVFPSTGSAGRRKRHFCGRY